jgi:RNA polymerase sigma-70 factor, ECF subfamily
MAEGTSNTIAFRQQQPAFRLLPEEGHPLETWSDEDLMLDQGRGNDAAFAELVRRHEKRVLNYIFRMVHNRHIAEELTQEVFMALVKNGQRYQPTAKFTTYLYTIASNIVRKEWSRQKRRSRLFQFKWWNGGGDEYDPLDTAADDKACVLSAFQQGEISEAINAALEKLPDHQREAFVLLRYQELSYQEISEIVEAPVGTVKSRVVRAERALRPWLERFREYL